jgi:hypothetical protein
MRRLWVTCTLTFLLALSMAGTAPALVVNDHGAHAGVALAPGSTPDLSGLGITTGTGSSQCPDPSPVVGLSLPPSAALCWQGGPVMHANETFAFAWDAKRRYWATTRDFVEQFLKDVAVGSGTLSSPYALTTQYTDPTGRAANDSTFGGACIDFGDLGGSACQLGRGGVSIPGNHYPANDCQRGGVSYNGSGGMTNDVCLTDAALRPELAAVVNQLESAQAFQAGHTPLITMVTPPGVGICLDAGGRLCSANTNAPALFCSYHSRIVVGGVDVPYVVQPWTPYASTCDEPDIPALADPPTTTQIATDAGNRLVNPLSAAEIAAIVNPDLNGWMANSGAEINDNGGCRPLGIKFDTVTVGGGSYVLQREFNNAGVLESDLNALACAPFVNLAPTFVLPSPVQPGDVVAFDGTTTVSTLMVPNLNYHWEFGDGATATGPSAAHSYDKGGTYTVTLTVTDRGGNVASAVQTLTVLGDNGQPPPVKPPPTKPGSGKSGSGKPGSGKSLQARVQLMPQDLKTMLRRGALVRVTANQRADGLATLSIPRTAARRAHLKTGHSRSVVVGRGSVSGIKDGTVSLRLRLVKATAKKLGHLRHMKLTVRMTLLTSGGGRLVVDVAGRY